MPPSVERKLAVQMLHSLHRLGESGEHDGDELAGALARAGAPRR